MHTRKTSARRHSFPREVGSNKPSGGWPMLADAVSVLKERYEEHPDTDDEDDYHVKLGRDEATHDLYAAAGSIGNLTPGFLTQMYRAMVGETNTPVKPALSWDDAPRNAKVFWPSMQTSRKLHPTGVLNSGRAMPLKYWRSIPQEARKFLSDGRPNTPNSGLGFPELGWDPVLHGKIMLAVPKTMMMAASRRRFSPSSGNGGGATSPSYVYVGSHNFSAAAFGDERGSRPRNIELGIVLATVDRAMVEEWMERFPYVLPPPTDDANGEQYVPMTAPSNIRKEWMEAYQAGDAEGRRRAEATLREWLSRDDEAVGSGEGGVKNASVERATKKPASRENADLRKCNNHEVIDLCSDDSD